VPDRCFISNDTPHLVSHVVRPNPFTVMPDVPYRLDLTVTTAVTAVGHAPAQASSDFDDTAEGFVVDLDGDPRRRTWRP
jgi:hypothetical protein